VTGALYDGAEHSTPAAQKEKERRESVPVVVAYNDYDAEYQ
jgi:hypothetical protein